MYATGISQSSPESPRPRKKPVHSECGEPIKGHHRVNGVLVCQGRTNTRALVVASKTAMSTRPENNSLDAVSQPRRARTTEITMEHTVQFFREAKARPNWADVAIAAMDTFGDLWKYTLMLLALLLGIFFYTTRDDAATPYY
ncbi:hypothetical protein C8R45DRAFT_1086548 [Mycena sanguinolenta]|nr:hypothetical protein C8R45DRAFT_1086548 [Mycena sanguinolenta]